MLEDLDGVDWASLEHAYGEAADVPDLLRALLSTDSEVREEAVYELFGNIWHQGTVYPASAAAVPFLYELLTAPMCGINQTSLTCWLVSPMVSAIWRFMPSMSAARLIGGRFSLRAVRRWSARWSRKGPRSTRFIARPRRDSDTYYRTSTTASLKFDRRWPPPWATTQNTRIGRYPRSKRHLEWRWMRMFVKRYLKARYGKPDIAPD